MKGREESVTKGRGHCWPELELKGTRFGDSEMLLASVEADVQ